MIQVSGIKQIEHIISIMSIFTLPTIFSSLSNTRCCESG